MPAVTLIVIVQVPEAGRRVTSPFLSVQETRQSGPGGVLYWARHNAEKVLSLISSWAGWLAMAGGGRSES